MTNALDKIVAIYTDMVMLPEAAQTLRWRDDAEVFIRRGRRVLLRNSHDRGATRLEHPANFRKAPASFGTCSSTSQAITASNEASATSGIALMSRFKSQSPRSKSGGHMFRGHRSDAIAKMPFRREVQHCFPRVAVHLPSVPDASIRRPVSPPATDASPGSGRPDRRCADAIDRP